LAEEWLSVLGLAKALGNVSTTCKQYQEYKRRFQTRGGLNQKSGKTVRYRD
jgi:hypothetical protein